MTTTKMTIALQAIFGLLFFIAVMSSIMLLINGAALPQGAVEKMPGRLDNILRYMAGLYLGLGVICLWMAFTMNQQSTLVYFVALTVFLGALGRIISIGEQGMPGKMFYAYLIAELVLPILIVVLQYIRAHRLL